jgi:DNA-binding MarR family transcriptional regulator
MHIIFFGLKRAHHGVLRIMRGEIAEHGLTAARFDLLYAVLERLEPPQVDLCRALGVSAPTVSRMVTSLQKLGLVERKTSSDDRRVRLVVLTDAGRTCIQEAIERFVSWGTAQLAVDSALCGQQWNDRALCSQTARTLDTTLDKIRRAYGDLADLYRPWEPDRDDNPMWDADPLLRTG